jgi:hypothetical protein
MELLSVLSACSPNVMFKWFQCIITARCNRPFQGDVLVIMIMLLMLLLLLLLLLMIIIINKTYFMGEMTLRVPQIANTEQQ